MNLSRIIDFFKKKELTVYKTEPKVQSSVSPSEPTRTAEEWMREFNVGINRRFRCENDISSIVTKTSA